MSTFSLVLIVLLGISLFFCNYSGISFTAGNAAIPGGLRRWPPGMAAFPG